MSITEQPPTATMEYDQRSDITAVNVLAAQGWQLHSVVPCGPNAWYVMQRQTGAPTGPASAELVAERDWLREQVAAEQGRAFRAEIERGELAEQLKTETYRADTAAENNGGLRTERDRLARATQRVRDLHRPATVEVGLPSGAAPRCVVCKVTAPCDTISALGVAGMTPGELLQVRRADPDGGQS